MGESGFTTHIVKSRKDILQFMEEHCGKGFYKKIRENPKALLEEIDIISSMLGAGEVVGGTGFHEPPVTDPSFIELGENIFLYRGNKPNCSGIWVKEKGKSGLEGKVEESNPMLWTRYSIGSRAYLRINDSFKEMQIEGLLPDNVEKKGVALAYKKDINNAPCKGKRPVIKFSANCSGREFGVYAKGSEITCSHYYDYSKPSYRITNISSIHKSTSRSEVEKNLSIGEAGVMVPQVVGYYESLFEEFLFVEEIKGKTPDKFLPRFKHDIIKQDAEMLASLCLSGYRKQWFADFDDKIFDGKDLYLIDVDECIDLYFPDKPDYRKILLNPNDKRFDEFRSFQKSIFRQVLKDAIFDYKDSLLPNTNEQKSYISYFYKRLGCKEANEKEIKELLTFGKNFLTFDSHINLMSDTD